nr:hypothetical protein CFP56_44558 [Quercus suber]
MSNPSTPSNELQIDTRSPPSSIEPISFTSPSPRPATNPDPRATHRLHPDPDDPRARRPMSTTNPDP